jgi:flagellar hook protein FlgE
MSLFGAMTTAISGLSAQSTSFSNIGDNLANTQTTGYKSVGTTFGDYITTSNLQVNDSGAVVARPDYSNSLQGSISQSTSPLNLAISGQGFFPVSTPNGDVGGLPTFDSQQLYTRNGDFKLDQNGYLVNSTGHYLNGWVEGPNGQPDQTNLVPLQVGQNGYAPVKTSTASIAANLPATPSSTAPVTTEVPVYDAVGTANNLELTWTPSSTPNTWSLSISQKGSATPLGSVDVAFGAAGNPAAPEGTVGSVTTTSGSVTGSTYGAGQGATVGITADFGLGPQPISINLGTFGGTDGVTQFAGTSYNLVSLSQNGVKPGSFSSVSMQPNGDVIANYDNGSSRTLARIPVVTFSSPDSLQRQDGQAFLATTASGEPRVNQAGGNGAGTLVTSSLEASNVDIANEFTKLIVAQRAYSANTKMVTTADDMLQQTIDMKR